MRAVSAKKPAGGADMRPSAIYVATKMDILMAAGGPMGVQPTTLWTKHFATLELAKAACDADYKRQRKLRMGIRWRNCSGSRWSSGDLGAVMYDIHKTKLHQEKQ